MEKKQLPLDVVLGITLCIAVDNGLQDVDYNIVSEIEEAIAGKQYESYQGDINDLLREVKKLIDNLE